MFSSKLNIECFQCVTLLCEVKVEYCTCEICFTEAKQSDSVSQLATLMFYNLNTKPQHVRNVSADHFGLKSGVI